MIRRGVQLTVLGLATAGVLAGCDDASGPGEFAGSYRLERFEGRDLPAIRSISPRDTVYVVTEDLLLDDDGDGVVATTARRVGVSFPQGSTSSSARPVRYTVRDGVITIVARCPIDADCIGIAPLTGQLVPGGLAFGAPESSKPASFYRRTR